MTSGMSLVLPAEMGIESVLAFSEADVEHKQNWDCIIKKEIRSGCLVDI